MLKPREDVGNGPAIFVRDIAVQIVRAIACLGDGYYPIAGDVDFDVVELRPLMPMIADAYRDTAPIDLTGDWGAHERPVSFAGEAVSSSGSRKTIRPPTGRDSS